VSRLSQFDEYLDEQIRESIDASEFEIQGLKNVFCGSDDYRFPSDVDWFNVDKYVLL
jgi:hypothetical protein